MKLMRFSFLSQFKHTKKVSTTIVSRCLRFAVAVTCSMFPLLYVSVSPCTTNTKALYNSSQLITVNNINTFLTFLSEAPNTKSVQP